MKMVTAIIKPFKLDEVREYDTVDVGTHVYYAEGSDRMLIPTGEIYITFLLLYSLIDLRLSLSL